MEYLKVETFVNYGLTKLKFLFKAQSWIKFAKYIDNFWKNQWYFELEMVRLKLPGEKGC